MARPTGSPLPQKRDGYWYFTRYVPSEFKAIDPRRRVVITTGIPIADDPRAIRAKQTVAKLDSDLTRFWIDKRSGRDPEIVRRYNNAVATAPSLGITYLEKDFVDRLRLDAIVDRLALLQHLPDGPKLQEAAVAVAGIARIPGLMLSELRTEGERHLAAELKPKSDYQRHRWRSVRDYALKTFIDIVGGDRPLKDVNRQDVLAVRDHWQKRILNENIAVNTGNKNIGRVAGLFNIVNDMQQLGLPRIFEGVHIKGDEGRQRVKYETAFIQDHFLAEGLFAELNVEARRIIYLIIETGLRPSEACNLLPHRIILDGDVPHVQVRPDLRKLKTKEFCGTCRLSVLRSWPCERSPTGFRAITTRKRRSRHSSIRRWMPEIYDLLAPTNACTRCAIAFRIDWPTPIATAKSSTR